MGVADTSTVKTIRFGDSDVPLLQRPWREAVGVEGYRKTYGLRPGDRWVDAEVSSQQYEALVDVGGLPTPVGVVIARELIASGAQWAFSTEMWGGLVLLNHDAVCIACSGEVQTILDELRHANGDSLSGLPDVIALKEEAIVLREAKRAGKDRLQPQQHRFARSARRFLGDRLDLAVVEWAPIGYLAS